VSFEVEYDAGALSLNASTGAAAAAAGKLLDSHEASAGRLRIIVFGPNQDTIAEGAVAVLTVTSKTSDTATFPLRLSHAAATDPTGTAVPLALLDGRFSTESLLPRITAVVHAATSQPGIPAGGWIEIHGSGFAASTRAWSLADLAGGRLPERLLNVGVEIGGRPAYISFVSPNRIEALAPGASADFEVSVRVLAPQGASIPFPATSHALAPGFFPAVEEAGRYLLAMHADGTAVNRNSPARPGEVVVLSGTGFGFTDPQSPEGMSPAVAPLARPIAITVGGESVNVQFAGIVAPGRYQFNIVIPEGVAAGDHEIIAEIGGVRSPSGRYIAIGP
jgi:uncharacterized protein (TIGR03437 family)